MDDVWFRTRGDASGALQVWLRGSRLEKRWLIVVPALLAASFLFSSAAIGFRLLGCAALLGCTLAFVRLSQLGLRLSAEGITVVDVVRSGKIRWADVMGFVGDRSGGEGRCLLVRADGSTMRLAGVLHAEELSAGEGEGDLSAIDEVNMIVERYRRGVGRSREADPGPSSPGARRLSALD